jgi:multicomponent Na+:H+ antiporter subunit E
MKILRKTYLIISFLFYYLKEIIQANLKVAYEIVTPRHHMKPGILIIPIQVHSSLELLILVNLITMTPGTLAMDVAPDRSAVYIHAMYTDNPEDLRQNMELGFLKRIREVFQ